MFWYVFSPGTLSFLGLPPVANRTVLDFKTIPDSKVIRKIFFCLKYLTVLTIVWSNEAGSLSHIEPIHSHDELMIDLDVGWESRYFSEGRDALDVTLGYYAI